MRLCNHQIKKLIDATVVSCTVTSAELHSICVCDWKLKQLFIEGTWSEKSLGNEDTVLPNSLFKKFPLLETLEIQGCIQLEAFPKNIGNLRYLKDLKLRAVSKLATFPQSLRQLTSLKLYGCWDLTLKGLAPLKQLQQLKKLDIGGWTPRGDSSLPEWVFDNITTGLLELRLRDTVQPLPSTISNFKHLTRLILEDIFESGLPDSIGLLSSLRNLHIISWSGLVPVELPESISMLSALKELDLTVKLEDIALLQHLTGLTSLNLPFCSGDNFEFLEVIWTLTSLKALRLFEKTGAGPARWLPDDIGKLKNLESLYLNDSRKLHELPESIGNLSCLTKLDLSGTGVESLPDTIGKLDALKVLILTDCHRLNALPESFADLVLGKGEENWSLEQVVICDCPNLALSPKMEQAMELLRRRGVLIEE